MNQQQEPAGKAGIEQDFLDSQVDLFLFDLKNEANEHGFKQGESWTLELATEQEMMSLTKVHHPIVSLRLQPSSLLKVYHGVKTRLKQTTSAADITLTDVELTRNDKKHLAAYRTKLTLR